MSLPACIKLPSGFFADPLVFVKRVNIDRTKVAKDELEPETLRKALMDIWLRSLVDKDEGQQRVKRYEEGQQRVKKNAAAIIPQCQRLCYDYQDALAAKAAAKAAALLEAKNTLTVAVDQSTATAAASGAGLLSVGDPTIVCTGAHPASNLPQVRRCLFWVLWLLTWLLTPSVPVRIHIATSQLWTDSSLPLAFNSSTTCAS